MPENSSWNFALGIAAGRGGVLPQGSRFYLLKNKSLLMLQTIGLSSMYEKSGFMEMRFFLKAFIIIVLIVFSSLSASADVVTASGTCALAVFYQGDIKAVKPACGVCGGGTINRTPCADYIKTSKELTCH